MSSIMKTLLMDFLMHLSVVFVFACLSYLALQFLQSYVEFSFLSNSISSGSKGKNSTLAEEAPFLDSYKPFHSIPQFQLSGSCYNAIPLLNDYVPFVEFLY